jgi:hypothetical protein
MHLILKYSPNQSVSHLSLSISFDSIHDSSLKIFNSKISLILGKKRRKENLNKKICENICSSLSCPPLFLSIYIPFVSIQPVLGYLQPPAVGTHGRLSPLLPSWHLASAPCVGLPWVRLLPGGSPSSVSMARSGFSKLVAFGLFPARRGVSPSRPLLHLPQPRAARSPSPVAISLPQRLLRARQDAPAHLPLAAGPCHARRAPSGLLCSPRFSLVPRRALPSVFNVEHRHLSGVLRWPQIEALPCAQSSDPLRARSLRLPQPRSGRPSSTRRPLGSAQCCWSCPSAPVASSCYSMPRQSPCCSSAPSRAILCSVRAVFLQHAAPSPCSLFFSVMWSPCSDCAALAVVFGLLRIRSWSSRCEIAVVSGILTVSLLAVELGFSAHPLALARRRDVTVSP